jgi:hypothetical protein
MQKVVETSAPRKYDYLDCLGEESEVGGSSPSFFRFFDTRKVDDEWRT